MLDQKIIDLEKLTKPEIMKLNRRQNFTCLTCKKPVVIKKGTRKRPHFAHEKEGVTIGASESATHLLVKHALAKWLQNQYIHATVEKRFTTIDRIADVYFQYENVAYAIEIQKSPMSDGEFEQRISDYRSVGITVLWVFLGELIEKGRNLYRLPPVMLGRHHEKLIHFCNKTAQLRIFFQPVFVTTKDVYAKPVCCRLSAIQMTNLLKKPEKQHHFDPSWLDIKRRFRTHSWFYVSKSERKLLEQCLLRGFNLSQLPTEIGWPVAAYASGKHLFVWQAYVLLTIMKYFKIGEQFTSTQLVKFMAAEYQLEIKKDLYQQVINYLKWLQMFGIIKENHAFFEYVQAPIVSQLMEEQMKRDEKFVQVVAKLWKV